MVIRSRRPGGRDKTGRPTRRGSGPRTTARARTAPPAKNNTPLIIAACVGGFFLLVARLFEGNRVGIGNEEIRPGGPVLGGGAL